MRNPYHPSVYPDPNNPTCGGIQGQLCAVWDGRSGATRFTYEPAPTGPPRVKTVTDRRGLVSTYSYGQSQTTVTTGTHVQAFTGIDAAGRVATRADTDTDTDTSDVLYHQTDVTWDTPTAPCNQPDPGLDHNPCRVTDRQVSTAAGAAPGHDTQVTYSEQGLPLSTQRATGSGGYDVTTVGFRTQHVGPTRTRVYTDSLAGGAAVTSTTGTSGKRADDGEATLFTITDRTASLTPRGNNAPQPAAATASTPGWPAYASTYTLDATETVTPGAVPSSGVCTGGATNTGLVCAVDAPAFDGTGRASTTRYSYDSFGQRTTMTTPKATAETPAGSTPPAYRYAYFADSDRDLSTNVSAGGWLRAVTDPAGKFVAFGYDAAGDVARTWDRNATAGRAAADFGTTAAPTTGQYTESLYGDPGARSCGDVVEGGHF